jgi:hypothetical protein
MDRHGFFMKCCRDDLQQIDMNKYKEAKNVTCFGNKLQELDVNMCKEIERLYCANNKIKRIQLKGLKKLECINIGKNPIKELVLEGCDNVWHVSINDTPLEKLDLSMCKKVSWISAYDCNNLLELKLPEGAKVDMHMWNEDEKHLRPSAGSTRDDWAEVLLRRREKIAMKELMEGRGAHLEAAISGWVVTRSLEQAQQIALMTGAKWIIGMLLNNKQWEAMLKNNKNQDLVNRIKEIWDGGANKNKEGELTTIKNRRCCGDGCVLQ